MDVWVALAAAGAGYVAKNLKKLNKDKEKSSEFAFGDPKIVTPQAANLKGNHTDKSCLFRKLIRRPVSEEENFNQIDSKEDVSSMSSGHLENDPSQVTATELGISDIGENVGYLYSESRLTEVCSPYDSRKNRSSLRSRRSNLLLMKPLTSLDSCLLAQSYNEHAELDEYVLKSCFPSPSSPSTRPFIVTDGRRIIGREGANSINLHCGTRKNRLHKENSLLENNVVCGVSSLPYNMSLEVSRRGSARSRGLCGKLNTSVAREKQSISLADSTNGVLLFGLGVSVGLISSLLANKREVDKLNGLLKQTENLVQDLQDELEMKDQLTVKELPIEDFKAQDTNSEPYYKKASQSFPFEHNLNGSKTSNGNIEPDQRGDDDLESMGKIEAELEAELERLEMNMTSSSLERRLSDLVETGPNFVPDISQGELRPDMFGAQAGDMAYADQDGSGTSTPNPANYSVSHRELTLRLHELIQTRLEERVKELEKALEVSERKVRVMESERRVVNNESVLNPVEIDERNIMDQPVIINLSGEALDAYNEAYDELNNGNEYKEYDSKGRVKEKDYYDEHYTCTDVNALPKAESTLDWQTSSGDIGCSGTESESDDEFEKMLIKQIVEKNRRNSTAILNVERKLFEDKCEQ